MANKAELIENVASSTGLTKKDATAAVDAVFSTIQETLAKGEKAQLVKDVTHKLDKKFKSLQAKYLHSNQVKH